MTATPTLLALLEMEQVVDDLDGISNVLSRMSFAPEEMDGEGPTFMANLITEKVVVLQDQWQNAVKTARGAAPGPALVDDSAAEGGAS